MSIDRQSRRAIAARFDNPLLRQYIRWKLSADPAYGAVATIAAENPLPLIDIGCGIGLLGHYVYACGALEQYIGLDHDGRKIEAGQVAVSRAGLGHLMELRDADAASIQPMKGYVAMLDVLHYLPADRQRALLETAAAHVADDGCLILRNVIREPNWRYHLTVLEERWLRVSGFMKGGAQHFPTAEEIRLPLEQAGLTVEISPLRGRTPFNSYLVIGRRPNLNAGNALRDFALT
jgi:2-polyprenyl-3-methyl-5-hydroxy-6-metoxy-1,4-benzoquinol methylase